MKNLTLTILLVLAATTASAGTLFTEWHDCTPIYKLFSVSWQGPWNSGPTHNLESSSTNHGPWETVVADTGDSGCWFPATNLRWYRMRTCLFPLACVVDSNLIWVPQQICNGNPQMSATEVRT